MARSSLPASSYSSACVGRPCGRSKLLWVRWRQDEKKEIRRAPNNSLLAYQAETMKNKNAAKTGPSGLEGGAGGAVDAEVGCGRRKAQEQRRVGDIPY